MRDAIGDFRVLQKGDDDAEEAENASGGDQAARIERAGTGFAFVFFLCCGFDQRANQATSKHGPGGGDGKIRAGGKS